MSVALKTKEKFTSEELIDKAICLAKSNNLKVKWVWGDLFIESIFDSWFIEDYGTYVELYHKNTANKNYHLQRRFTNTYQAIDSIIKHDGYKLKTKIHVIR